MTTYQGGKKRLAKKIHNVIIEFEKKHSNIKLPYFEPFLGMGSIMSEFGKDNDNRELAGCDINKDVIEMWKALQNGWTPPSEVSKEMYLELKKQKEPSPERGFVGSSCSFAGQFFHGYKEKYDINGKKRNYAEMGIRSIKKVLPYMMNVNILNSQTYENFNPINNLIYCDPPYHGNKISTCYFQNFDHDKFWEKMREWSRNNIVIISELNAPQDFISIWNNNYIVSHMKNHINTIKNFTEKLFVHESLL